MNYKRIHSISVPLYMFGFSFASCQSPHFHIGPQFDEVLPFHRGIAAVRTGQAWGFIDTAGTWVIKPAFVQAELQEGEVFQVIDASGQILEIKKSPETGSWAAQPRSPRSTPVETTSGTRYIFEDNGHFGIRDGQANTLAEAVYDSLHFLGNNLFTAWLTPRGECLLNADGKILSGFFQEITPKVQYGRIRFRDNDQYGLLAPDGRVILLPSLWRLDIAGHHIACTHGGKFQLHTDRLEKLSELQFDEVIYLDEDHWLAKITDTGQGTIFNLAGQVVKSDIHLSDGKMMFGRFPVKDAQSDKWGYMNSKGETVIPCTFYYTDSFWPNGKAVIWDRDETGRVKKGLIDTTGQLAHPPVFDVILWHPDGVYTVVQDDKYQLLDEDLRPLTQKTDKPTEYLGRGVYAVYAETKSLKFRKSNWYTGEKGGFSVSREAEMAAVYALDGQLLVRGKDLVENEPLPKVSEGFAAVKKNGKWGYVKCKDAVF